MIQRLPLISRSDDRGQLIQSEYPEVMAQVQHFLVSYSRPGVVRGNHYHQRKKEWFLVIQGQMELHLLELDTQKKDVITVHSDQPELVVVEPNVVHAFQNIGQSELIFLGLINEPFDHDEPDTYPYEILKAT